MLALRLVFTVLVMVGVLWLLRTGAPLGALLLLPALAILVRRWAETGRLARVASRGRPA